MTAQNTENVRKTQGALLFPVIEREFLWSSFGLHLLHYCFTLIKADFPWVPLYSQFHQPQNELQSEMKEEGGTIR